MHLTPRRDADYQTARRVELARLGIWLSAGAFLAGGLRLATGDGPSPVTGAPLVVGVAGLVMAALLPFATLLPLGRIVSHRHVDAFWAGAVAAQLAVLVAFVAADKTMIHAYAPVTAIITVYAAVRFSTSFVLWLGSLAGLAYAALAISVHDVVLPLIVAVLAAQAANLALCVRISRGNARRDALRLRAERWAEALLGQASDVVFAIDRGAVVRYQSPSTTNVLGYQPDQLLDQPIVGLCHPGDRPLAARWFEALLAAEAGHSALIEARVRRADGGWCHTEVSGTNRLGDPALDAIVLNIRDVGAKKELEERLTRQAFRDALTGLANRALLRDRVAHAVARGKRSASTIALMLIDLDGFKILNDAVGHARGDELLVTIASRLGTYVRPSDTLARLGADEFALLVEDRIDEEAAVALGERLAEAIRRPIDLGGRDFFITASIGITVVKAGVSGADDAEELLRDADLAGYAAKSTGGDRCVLFDAAMHVGVLREAEQRSDLESAFADDQFTVRYQPIVDLPTLRMVGVEALVRWRHPTRGILGPTEFIPLAESTGLIVPLGRWVLQQACAQVALWQRTIPGARGMRVSVNLSARQFQYPELVEDVEKVLRSTGISPNLVVLEITESLLMLDAEATIATLQRLKALGVRLAIDDFGTGYSSLSYLRRFPVDIIKIDRSFIDGLTTGTEDSTLTEAVVQLGRSLRLQTIAEGIETPEQSARLKALGCEFGQGFLFAKPVTPEDIEPMLAGPAD